ncbi:hypothetical protein GT037_008253 [Alternaria burnsii]|uniref:Uncharacterized protein n=1 Tax=Alternaria burnsii TaxID=1187904 RepID=A0A8H7B1K3_9PLEO|nr:uncharacterized protein GT037_008253 [Alternaria burnsii]KAF7673638.1 hypothetical protein GT037_008253 [Alternaria burnsii]
MSTFPSKIPLPSPPYDRDGKQKTTDTQLAIYASTTRIPIGQRPCIQYNPSHYDGLPGRRYCGLPPEALP